MPVDQPDKPSQKSQFAKLHGLIIGINSYKAEYRQNLQGCVGDAMAIFKFFTDLGAPHENLLCLYDEEATRERILSKFEEHLIKNPNIQKYDPIVIYFAGHGDRMPAPPGWHTSDGMVEMILPHDASYASSGTDNPSAQTAGVRRANTLDETRNYVYGIPDLTLAFLLYRLSEEKGNNITVILDSCHSGSGTRGEIRSRNSHDSQAPPIPSDLDLQVRKSMSAAYPSELKHIITTTQTSGKLMAPSMETHILLAACQYDELAQEIPNFGIEPEGSSCGGIFTTTLLKELRRCDIGTTSYTTFIRNLLASRHEQHKHYKTTERVGVQTFQCEGQNQDRLLFSVQYSTSRGKIALIPTKDRSIYRVRVGSAQGIVPGTEFRVFADKMHPNARPIILVARDVGSLVSHLHGQNPNEPPEIPEDAYATIIKYNDHSNRVRIWVDDAVDQSELWKQVIDIGSLDPLPISWATSPENHDVALLPANGSIELRASHLTPGQLPISHVLKKDLDAKKLAEILASVVDFHFHLKIQNKIAPVRAHLGMALRELGGKYNNWGAIYEPKGDDLFGNSVTDGTVATLRADPKKPFGIELTNRSMVDLYPYVFYYDFEDYSVGCLYGPPGRTVRAPLPAGNSLTIGYGSGGSQPFQVDFTNPKSEKEYGAFVLMVFSNWVDVSYLQQQSPFEGALHRGKRPLDKDGVWDSITVRVELVKEK